MFVQSLVAGPGLLFVGNCFPVIVNTPVALWLLTSIDFAIQ